MELKDVSKPQEDVSFNHPYFIDAGRLRAILSSLYFREAGLFKKKTGRRIFLDREIDTLVPLIVESLSKATPHKEVFVTVLSEKTLLRDQSTTCSLFVLGKELNIAFSQMRTTKEESPTFKDWKTPDTKESLSSQSGGLWELVPGVGQRLNEGYKSWLVIDVEDRAFEPVIAAVEKETLTPSSLIEERLRRLEERAGFSSGEAKHAEAKAEQSTPTVSPKKEVSSGKTLGQKLRELKTLLNGELISLKDYEKKKLELLQEEPPQDKSVPDMLKELRGLKDEGLITEGDYEQWKKRLLEKL